MFRILNHKYLLCCVSCNLISSFIIINNESVSVVIVKLNISYEVNILRLHRIEMCIGNEKINLCMNIHESCLHGLSVVWTEVLVKSQRRKEY